MSGVLPGLSRRSLLGAGAAVSAAAALGPERLLDRGPAVKSAFSALEQKYKAKLGIYAVNTRTKAALTHRADERFAFCSTFKALAAAAVLRDRDKNGEFLATVIPYEQKDMVPNSPISENHVGKGMRVDELCAATIDFSDNTAGNLILRAIGGPPGLTRFCRSLGDTVTRSDRWETDLNTAIPGDLRDTTTPRAIGGDYQKLMLGNGLTPADRTRLVGWLMGNTTSTARLHAGLPAGWLIADKTGLGDYASNNDVGVAWTTRGTPVLITIMSRMSTKDAKADNGLIADAARIIARTLTPGE